MENLHFENNFDLGVWQGMRDLINQSGVSESSERLVGKYIAGLWLHTYNAAQTECPVEDVHTVVSHPAILDTTQPPMFGAAMNYAGELTGFRSLEFQTEHQTVLKCIVSEKNMVRLRSQLRYLPLLILL